MTTNEAIAKYNFISKVLLQNGNDELSKELKVKVMTMRIDLSKIKKTFDEDSKALVDELITDDINSAEYRKYKEMLNEVKETFRPYYRSARKIR